MKNYKIKTKGMNQEIWDKMGRLTLEQMHKNVFIDKQFITINSNGNWGWCDKEVFDFCDFKKISAKNFLRLPEPDPFKGREYYVMCDDPKEIDYLLMIAEARGFKMIAGYEYRYDYIQFTFKEKYKMGGIGANSLESEGRGTKLTLSQFISGTWSDEFIVGEYYRSDELVVKMTMKRKDPLDFGGVVIEKDNNYNVGHTSSNWDKQCFTHLPNYEENLIFKGHTVIDEADFFKVGCVTIGKNLVQCIAKVNTLVKRHGVTIQEAADFIETNKNKLL